MIYRTDNVVKKPMKHMLQIRPVAEATDDLKWETEFWGGTLLV